MMGSLLVIEGNAPALPLPSGAHCPTDEGAVPPNTIRVVDFAFIPGTLEVPPDTTVTFDFTKPDHTVTTMQFVDAQPIEVNSGGLPGLDPKFHAIPQFEKRDVVIRGGVGEDRVHVRDPPYGNAWDDSHRVRIQDHRKEQVTLWQRQDRANEGSQKSRAGCTAGFSST
jgi:hypothetical protein